MGSWQASSRQESCTGLSESEFSTPKYLKIAGEWLDHGIVRSITTSPESELVPWPTPTLVALRKVRLDPGLHYGANDFSISLTAIGSSEA